MLQEEARWFNKNGPGICPFDAAEKSTSLAKPLRTFSQCIPLFLEFSGTSFPSTDIFPPLQVCLCCCIFIVLVHEWMFFSVRTQHMACTVCAGTFLSVAHCMWEQLPHCSLTDAALSSSVCCGYVLSCLCSPSLLKWWKDLGWWWRGVWNDLLGSWRKERHGSLGSSAEVLFHHRSRNIVQQWEVLSETTWTHWITLYTPFGNFTPIDTLLFAATTKTKSTCGLKLAEYVPLVCCTLC